METFMGFAGYTLAPFLDLQSLASLARASLGWSTELRQCPHTWKKAAEHQLASRYPGFTPEYLGAMRLAELQELLAFTVRATRDMAACTLQSLGKKPALSASAIMKRRNLDYDTSFRGVVADCIVDDLYTCATGKLRPRLINSYIDPMAYHGFIATVLDMLAIEYGDDESLATEIDKSVHLSVLEPIQLYRIPASRDRIMMQNTMHVLASMIDLISRSWMLVDYSVLNPIIFHMIWMQYVQLGLAEGREFVDWATVNTIQIYLSTACSGTSPLLARLTALTVALGESM